MHNNHLERTVSLSDDDDHHDGHDGSIVIDGYRTNWFQVRIGQSILAGNT